jgi:hypothetical protein
MEELKVISLACEAVRGKAAEQNKNGLNYLFKNDDDVKVFFKPFYDKITGGRHTFYSFIQLCVWGLNNDDVEGKPCGYRWFTDPNCQPNTPIAMKLPENLWRK